MRRVLATTAAVLLATTIAACGGGAESTEASGKAPAGLLKSGELTVCTDPEYPPMEYFKDGDTSSPVGFDPDAARALADLWELDIKWQNTAFDGLMPALQAKRCDILWAALYMSPERLEVADGSPFMETGPGLIVRTDTSDITTADDLSGKTVAVQGGGSNEQTLRDLSSRLESEGKPGITVQPYPKTSETVAALSNSKADALIETDVAVVDMVEKSQGKLKSIPDVFPADTQFGVFTLKGSPLSPAVSTSLKELDANGTLSKLAEQYGLDPNRIVT